MEGKIDKIIEEAMMNMIRRIEELEEFNRKYYSNQNPPKQFQQTPGQATQNQKNYIVKLGGVVSINMTKQEAGKEIDRLLETKEGIEDELVESVVEPKEVDSDETGIDEEGLI